VRFKYDQAQLECEIKNPRASSFGRLFPIRPFFSSAELRRPFKPTPGGVTLEEFQRSHILQVMQQTGWRVEGPKGAARILGLNPSTLRSRMLKLGIRCPSQSHALRTPEGGGPKVFGTSKSGKSRWTRKTKAIESRQAEIIPSHQQLYRTSNRK